jgi:hypothetical protein
MADPEFKDLPAYEGLDEQIARVAKEVSAALVPTVDNLPMKDILNRVDKAQDDIAPDKLDRGYLEVQLGAGFIVEWGTYNQAFGTGTPITIAALNFQTRPVYFDVIAWPLTTWTNVWKMGSIVGTTGPPYTCTATWANATTAQTFTITWFCVRERR